jgi:hypothetical protein
MKSLSDGAFIATKEIEISIRGEYLRFSARLEGLILKCIICLNEMKTKITQKEEQISYKKLMFNQKISKFKELLKFIYSDLGDSNNTLFDNLETFKTMRNKMAHCYFTWDEANLSFVTIWDLDELKLKHEPYRYSIDELFDDFETSKAKLINEINPLAEEIFYRLRPEIPYMFED